MQQSKDVVFDNWMGVVPTVVLPKMGQGRFRSCNKRTFVIELGRSRLFTIKFGFQTNVWPDVSKIGNFCSDLRHFSVHNV